MRRLSGSQILLGLAMTVLGPVASAQPVPAAPTHMPALAPDTTAQVVQRTSLAVRITGGMASLSLGQAGDFHQAIADGYQASGIPVPTQRSFAPGLQVGADVLWAAGQGRQFGIGVRAARTSAYSLYGDYAGTLDLVSTVTAVFAETVSVAEFRPAGKVRPFVGSRGGTVFASAATRETLDLGEVGSSMTRVGGRGVGFSVEGFGGLTAAAGPVGVFIQGGYRYARVGRLTGSSEVAGATVEEGQLPYSLNLSGWTGLVGLTVRRP